MVFIKEKITAKELEKQIQIVIYIVYNNSKRLVQDEWSKFVQI